MTMYCFIIFAVDVSSRIYCVLYYLCVANTRDKTYFWIVISTVLCH